MSYEIRELSVGDLNQVSGGEVSLVDAARVIGGLTLVDTAVENAIAALRVETAKAVNGTCGK